MAQADQTDDYYESLEFELNCKKKGKESATVHMYKTVWLDYIASGEHKPHPQMVMEYERYKQILQRKAEEKAVKAGSDGRMKGELIFFTFNPPDGDTVEDSLYTIGAVLTKIFKKKWVKRYFYRIECRGVDDDGKIIGIHVHMVIHREYGGEIKKPAEALRELKSACKGHVKNVEDPHHVNISFPAIVEVTKLRSYILDGVKKGEPKTNYALDRGELEEECHAICLQPSCDWWNQEELQAELDPDK